MYHGNTLVPDSSCIARYLAATYPDTAGRLFPRDPRGAATAHLASRLCDEGLYPVLLYYRRECMGWRMRGARRAAHACTGRAALRSREHALSMQHGSPACVPHVGGRQ
jgi:glutathione S-transferase